MCAHQCPALAELSSNVDDLVAVLDKLETAGVEAEHALDVNAISQQIAAAVDKLELISEAGQTTETAQSS